MAKPKFNPVFYQNFTTNAKGELTYDDDTWNQINARNEAIQKIERANQLKLEIQTETNNLLAQYAKEKQGFERKAMIGKAAQFVADPRMWAKGVWEVGKMVTENPRDVFINAPRGALQSKEATKLYEQSAVLNNEATRLAQTDKAKSEELLRQSQELYNTAQEQYGKAVGNLGELTTGKQIAAKSALTGLDIGSFLPVGAGIRGSVAATQATSKLATKVPAAVQTTKLTGRANLISNALGLGDIYQGAQVAIKQGLGEATEQTLKGQAARAALQGPVYGTLQVLADEEQEDTLGNIVKSSFITGASASALTLGFGWVGRALVSKVSGAIPQAGTTPELPTPPTKAGDVRKTELERIQGIEADFLARTTEPTQDPIKQSLGAFDPETTIPMLDLTKTVKGNNIDFNPDSALSVNSARKVVDDLALLNGMQVGGKSLQIDKNDPKYQEIYNTQIKPLIDKINAVDEVAPGQQQLQFNKIPAEEVELEVSKIYNTLENEGFNIVPEKIVDTPAIDALDEKLANGDQPTAQEMDASMKELTDTTGDPEVIAGVQQELNNRVKKSRFFERVKSTNPEAIDPNASVSYEVAVMKEAEDFADNLVINDFDKAKEIAESINTQNILDPKVVKTSFAYNKKLIELGRNDEVTNNIAVLSANATRVGQELAAFKNSNIADPVSVILTQTRIRQTKFNTEIKTEVAKVKEQLNNVVIDKDAIIEILDNITCR
jgi:hypothetical protein